MVIRSWRDMKAMQFICEAAVFKLTEDHRAGKEGGILDSHE